MSKKLVCGMAASAAFLISALFAAAPPAFIPDSTFEGSSLKGWHVMGQADWRAENGELIGTPKSASGGWLVLDKSYQDVEFYASFRCTGDCQTGVLLRAQKTENGMKGIYVSLTKGDLASYRVTLDAQGRELSREKLGTAAGHYSICTETTSRPAASRRRRRGPAGSTGLPSRGMEHDSTHHGCRHCEAGSAPGEFHACDLAASSGGLAIYGLRTMDAWAVRPDRRRRHGRSGRLRPHRDLCRRIGRGAFQRCRLQRSDAQDRASGGPSSHFRMQRINDFYYSWCAAVADINHDGIQDIVAGPFYYLGPNFTERREFMPARTYNVSTEYTPSTWSIFAYDFTGDGWPDVCQHLIQRAMTSVREPEGRIAPLGPIRGGADVNSEIGLLHDMDGDGMPRSALSGAEGTEFASPDPANPTAAMESDQCLRDRCLRTLTVLARAISTAMSAWTWWRPAGWWEQPPAGSPQETWTFHPTDFGGGGRRSMRIRRQWRWTE